MSFTKAEQADAIMQLRALIQPGETIYTTLKHVSRSGMYRAINVHVMKDNQPRRIGYLVARAINARYDTKHEAVGIGGCGMDMGFHLVYTLSRVLFRDNFHCTGKGCVSNDHHNEAKRNYRKGRKHSDAGYALNHRWM